MKSVNLIFLLAITACNDPIEINSKNNETMNNLSGIENTPIDSDNDWVNFQKPLKDDELPREIPKTYNSSFEKENIELFKSGELLLSIGFGKQKNASFIVTSSSHYISINSGGKFSKYLSASKGSSEGKYNFSYSYSTVVFDLPKNRDVTKVISGSFYLDGKKSLYTLYIDGSNISVR